MEPEPGQLAVVRGLRLRDLVLVVRKHQVDATRVDVERVAEVALAHGRAFDVPAGPARSERGIPGSADLLVGRLRLLPQREVAHRLLVIFVGGYPHAGPQPLPVQVRQLAVPREGGYAEDNGSV